MLGSVDLWGTNIYFTNGVEDGWKWAGIQTLPQSSTMKAEVIDCENCAHCVELYDEKSSDAQTLKDAWIWIRKFFNDLMRS